MKLRFALLFPLFFAYTLPAFCLADAPAALAATRDFEDDDDDEEEEAVNYRDRVREVQDWLNRRELERQGRAPSLDLPAAPPKPSAAFPQYFQDQGTDANGYRRLDQGVRTQFSDAPQDPAAESGGSGRAYHRHRHHYRGRHYWRR